MALALVLGGMLGAGLWLIVMAQPLGGRGRTWRYGCRCCRRRAGWRWRRRARRRGDALFKSPALERLLRPLLEDAGGLARPAARPRRHRRRRTSSGAWRWAGRA